MYLPTAATKSKWLELKFLCVAVFTVINQLKHMRLRWYVFKHFAEGINYVRGNLQQGGGTYPPNPSLG
jgi:hypothetical protein